MYGYEWASMFYRIYIYNYIYIVTTNVSLWVCENAHVVSIPK